MASALSVVDSEACEGNCGGSGGLSYEALDTPGTSQRYEMAHMPSEQQRTFVNFGHTSGQSAVHKEGRVVFAKVDEKERSFSTTAINSDGDDFMNLSLAAVANMDQKQLAANLCEEQQQVAKGQAAGDTLSGSGDGTHEQFLRMSSRERLYVLGVSVALCYLFFFYRAILAQMTIDQQQSFLDMDTSDRDKLIQQKEKSS